MKPKVLFIILGLLVVCFLVGTGMNVSQSLGSQTEPFSMPAWGDTVRGWLEQPLRTEDVETALPPACGQQLRNGTFQLGQGSRCELIIAEASTNLRALSLELTEGVAATVVMDPTSDDRLTSTTALNARTGETTVRVSIFKEGGTLTILCNQGNPCRLAVKN
jgi:hypothetical protein